MESIYDWWPGGPFANREILILGKGPSFAFRGSFDLAHYVTIALNHVIEKTRADIFHAIDIDVVDDCEHAIAAHADWILMPWHPHRRCRSSWVRLPDYVGTVGVLQDFERRGRLLYYDFFTGRTDLGLPKVHGSFSATAVTTLMAQLGTRRIRTLGIDGGTSYATSFTHLNDRTLLANGHASFDTQFPEIQKVVQKMNVDFKPLVEPIRIFVGTDDTQMVGFQVLEHSIRKHTKHPVTVFPMRNMPLPAPRHEENRPGTGFSFNRFLIPKLAGYSGKALYMDADMLVFDDISKLWNLPMDGHAVLCSTQTDYPKAWGEGQHRPLHPSRHWKPGRQLSVMLLDCSQLDWDVETLIRGLDERKYTYKQLMVDMCIVPPEKIRESIPNSWNCLEWYEPGVSQNVHFTVVPTQPWKNDDNALTGLWESAFREAVRDNAVDLDLVTWSVNKGYVKPSLVAVAREAATTHGEPGKSPGRHPEDTTEASRLRAMLWDLMIKEYDERRELQRIRSSPAFAVEDLLVRRPLRFVQRAARAIGRRLRKPA